MQVVQPFHVRWESTPVLPTNLDLILAQTGPLCFALRDDDAAI